MNSNILSFKKGKNFFSLVLILIFGVSSQAQDYSPLKSFGVLPANVYNYSLGDNTSQTSNEFVSEYEFALRTIFRSGKVIIGDSLSIFVRKCADFIYEKNPNLAVASEFFVLKSTTPNAFAFPNGYIFITTGLLGQVENEAQLCFILAHEISHVQEKHGWESFNEKTDILKGKGDYSGLTIEQRLNLALRKSKTHELDADAQGFKLFKNLGYDNRQVLRAFDMLLYSYLPFDEIEFNYNFLSDSFYKFPTTFTTYVANDIEASEDEDDDELTHPNVKNRKLAIAKIVKDTGTNKDFIINEDFFKKIQKLARYENLYLHVQQGNLDKALYNTFLIEKHYGKSLFSAKVKAYAMVNYAISMGGGELSSSDFRMGLKEAQGNTQAVSYLLKKMKSKDALVLAKRLLLEGNRSYDNVFFTKLNDNLNAVFSSKWNTLYTSLIFGSTEESVSSESVSKIDKLKSNSFKTKKDSALYYNWAFYTLNPTEEEQKWLRSYQEITIGGTDTDDEYEADENEKSTKKEDKKNKYLEKEDAEKDKIKTLVLLKPNVLRIKSKSRGYKVNKLSDEELSASILESMIAMSQDFEPNFVALDPIAPSTEMDDYNKFAFVKHWISSYKKLEGELIPFDALDSANQRYIENGIIYMDTDVFSYRENREFNYIHILFAYVAPLLIPYYIYYYISKEHSTIIAVRAYDIGNNKLAASNISYFEAKGSKDFLKSHVYTMFFSILKHKKK